MTNRDTIGRIATPNKIEPSDVWIINISPALLRHVHCRGES
jgi:hypothetical protein